MMQRQPTAQAWFAMVVAGAIVAGAIGLDPAPRGAQAAGVEEAGRDAPSGGRAPTRPSVAELDAIRAAAAEEARTDIAAGRLVVRTYGLPSVEFGTYARLLEERHGIELRPVAGCIVDDEIVAATAAYNAVSRPEIERRFGRAVFERAQRDARKASELQFDRARR